MGVKMEKNVIIVLLLVLLVYYLSGKKNAQHFHRIILSYI